MFSHCLLSLCRTATIPAEVTTGAGSLLSSSENELTQQQVNQDWSSAQQQHGTGEGTVSGDTAMETTDIETLPPLSMSPSSSATPTQEDIVAFAEQYSLNLASKRFGVPIATIKKWMKSSSVPLTPKYNSPGQGRKISYSAELEQEMAEHIRELLGRGEKVTLQSVCSYARGRVQEEIPEFVASTGWANRFLARNNIDLSEQRDQRREMGTLQRDRGPDSRGRPLSYSIETDQAIANYVRQKLAGGYSLTNSELRRYAKEIIVKENRRFTGSASWAQNFLHRHKINLHGGESKEPASSSSPSPTVPPRVSPASPSTPLLSTTPLLTSSQTQYSSPVLSSSSSHFTSTIPGVSTTSVADTHLNPATEMHVVASSTPGFPNPSLSDGVMSLPAEYATDYPMKQALAILMGENIDPAMLTAEQVSSLQSTLSELTSDTVSLVELLNMAQQIQEQTGESGSNAAHLIPHGLDSAASGIYLGLSSSSDVFASGLTGAAATQVDPNTQAPTIPNPPRAVQQQMDPNHTSRPLSYAKETDMILAKWVQEQQAVGKKVTFASLRAYAKNLVSSENPNFNASVGWVTPFLLRHGLDLSINKKKTPRKSDSPHDIEMDDEHTSLAVQPPSLPPEQTPSPSVHRIIQEEHPLTPEQMMVPIQVVSPTVTPDGSSMIPTTVATCSPATLEGIRAVLEQGIQNLATECTSADQIQLAAQLQDQPLALPPASTALSQVVEPGSFAQVVTIDGQPVGGEEGKPKRQRVTPQKFNPKEDEGKFSVKKRAKGQRNRHRLSEKLDVVRLMQEHNLAPHFVCRMLGIANSTLAGWIKLVQQKGPELQALSVNKKRSNLSGQGRPLTYSRATDEEIAQWVQTQQKLGIQVMPAELAKYAQSIIREENLNFTASSGWAQKFLQRHSLQLAGKGSVAGIGSSPGPSGVLTDGGKSSPAVVPDQQDIPAAVQTEEVIAHEYSQDRPYPEEMEKHLVMWAKENVAAHGSLSLQELCRYAEEVVIPQNPMFVASLSWVFMFLYIHSIMLDPKPNIASIRSTPNSRKRSLSAQQEVSDQTQKLEPDSTPKRPCTDLDTSVSPSTGNLCEALLALSSQSQESGQPSVQAVLQVALRALHQQQQQQQKQQEEQLLRLQAQEQLAQAYGQAEAQTQAQQAVAQVQAQTEQEQAKQQGHEQANQQAQDEVERQAHEQAELQAEQRTEGLTEQQVEEETSAMEELVQQVEQPQQLEVQVDSLIGEAAELIQGSITGGESGKEEGTTPLPSTSSRPKGSVSKSAKGKGATNLTSPEKDSSSNTYFGKSAREFSVEEKEEVVRYANATTLQKAAIKYGVAAPTVWRWRVELKLHQPKYSEMQKKYIIKFAETNSLKEAAQRYGITGKTISNWRKALQADGELLGDTSSLLTQDAQTDIIESTSGAGDSQTSTSEVMFHFVVDGGEVVEVTGTVGGGVVDGAKSSVDPGPQGDPPSVQAIGASSSGNNNSSIPLEVTTDVDIENVGMEYDIVSSEGHVAKPRCTPQEKVQILQYALDHTIKEASQKFGVSPGTLYYWKRCRNSGKESSKEQHSAGQGTPGGSQRSVQSTKTPPAAPYSTVMEDTEDLLAASNSEEVVVQPEEFIASSDTVTSTSDAQTATITLSQALAGMAPDALQHLNPDLTLLQAVSSFLAGGAGAEGGRGGKDEKEGAGGNSRRRNSNSEGISSPTDVLVRPFPPQETHASAENEEGADRTEDGQKDTGGENQMEETPHVVSEEVVAMGDSADETSVTQEEEKSITKPTVEGKIANEESRSDALAPATPNDPIITSQGGTGSVGNNEPLTSSAAPGNEDRVASSDSSVLQSSAAGIPQSQSIRCHTDTAEAGVGTGENCPSLEGDSTVSDSAGENPVCLPPNVGTPSSDLNP